MLVVYTVMWLLISSILGCCLQDTILVIPPYPYYIKEVPQDVPLEDCWYARPQLLFTLYLRPKHGIAPKNPTYRYCPDDIHKYLVFFSTFEQTETAHQWADGACWGDQVV